MNHPQPGARSWFPYLVLLSGLALLAGCAAPQPPAATPPTAAAVVAATLPPMAAPSATAAPVALAAPTATRAAPSYSPAAKLVRVEPAGKCRWVIYMYLTGFAPNSRITVSSHFDEVECTTGKVTKDGAWTEPYGVRTDGNGRLMIDYLHEATGDYTYVFRDDAGNQASLPFHTDPPPTQTPRPGAAPAATRTPAATAVERQVVVKAATLNLRAGPGQNYPVVGKAAQGDRLYPVGRWGDCAWLQLAVLGRDDFVWVAGGSQYVALNVPCETLLLVTELPPTPVPPPTAVPRPQTGLLANAGPWGQGELLIKNGTDSDGVVILVDMGDRPVQAAYIRAAESFRMTQIADGTYRLYFSKGEAWDPARKQFTVNVSRQRFADTLEFGVYGGYEVTLYGVVGGNAATQGVAPGDFPAVP